MAKEKKRAQKTAELIKLAIEEAERQKQITIEQSYKRRLPNSRRS